MVRKRSSWKIEATPASAKSCLTYSGVSSPSAEFQVLDSLPRLTLSTNLRASGLGVSSVRSTVGRLPLEVGVPPVRENPLLAPWSR
jgi:hypothetical protein